MFTKMQILDSSSARRGLPAIFLAAFCWLLVSGPAMGNQLQQYEQFIIDAGEWMVSRQLPNGAYPYSDAVPSVFPNVQAISGLATLSAYQASCQLGACDTDFLDASILTGDYMINGGFGNFSPNTGFPRIRNFDPLFLVRLSNVSGDPQYADFLETNFWQRLEVGIYGPTNDWDIDDFIDHLITTRDASAALSGVVAAWDLGFLAAAASEAGITQFDQAIVDGTRTALGFGGDTSTVLGTSGFDIMGLTGGIWVAGVTGANVAPTTGSWAAANNNIDLVNLLLAQQSSEGGFLQSTAAGNNPIDVTNTVSQTTAFAVMALAEFDSDTYFTRISSALNALVNVFQEADGRISFYHPDVDPSTVDDPKPYVYAHAFGLYAVSERGDTPPPTPPIAVPTLSHLGLLLLMLLLGTLAWKALALRQ
ncbi:MAG: hypothetical protein EA370_10235 [Wenzhouxiangella sp.]|nr:MAG: hypothetical protein EA370_10235 [Wenzhouxiangella sp.]